MTSRPRTRLLIVTLAAALTAIAAAVILPGLLRTSNAGPALHLRQAGELTLPGGSTRFDYESLDPGRGLLFIAHLGDSQVIETDIRASRVIRVIPGLPDVHGVLVVPALHRVYATATGASQMAAIDEDTGQILADVQTRNQLAVIDPATHDSYYPVPDGPGGHPVLLTYQTAS